MVWAAYKLVRKNKGSAGVDAQTLQEFEQVRSKELYKLWNRLASGSYFASPVKRVEIPKSGDKPRLLGIPTVSDRIAQQVIKTYLEPRLDSVFMDYSYGYRPNRSAHQAVFEVRKNARKYAWVVDLDVQAFFEHVDHQLLYKALAVHVTEPWVMLYIRRWLEAPVHLPDGTVKFPEGKGTPQGGVISPLLSNLYLHYCMDKWMSLKHPEVKMVRYADDMIVHCATERQAVQLLEEIKLRFSACGLTVHPTKTRIVYCKKSGRGLRGKPVQFDFLGFSFRPIITRLRKGDVFFTV